MAKFSDDSVLDAALAEFATGTRMSLCTAQPANFAGIAAISLANAVLAGGDFTIANGDSSGRKSTISAKAGATVDTTGSGNHVAIDDGTTLLYVTTCDAISVTATGTVDFPTWKIEIADPV